MRDFTAHQDIALARSAKLIAWLVLAASGTVIVTGLVVTYLFVLLLLCLPLDVTKFQLQLAEIFLIVCGLTAILVAASSWHKMKQLRAGGRVIAEDLGGTLVRESCSHRRERRVLNVVGEMAVASGIPAPTVYLLQGQQGINAFAAGLTVNDAVIGVTQGCVERLNREQLQGVIAHEFSHILNGDMRLNLRLVGLLHGLLGISLFAEAMLQSAHELTSTSDENRDPVGEMGLAALMLLAGVMLWPVGLIGTLFGVLVMSATSRQREFLADAYAVQFTRNPEGLAGALKVLAGCDRGSRVRSASALEASHLFFAPGCRWMIGLLATHPPVEERVRRLDPQWDGVPLFEDVDDLDEVPEMHACSLSLASGAATSALASGTAGSAALEHIGTAADRGSCEVVGESLSATDENSSKLRQKLLESMSDHWQGLVRDAHGCQAALLSVWATAAERRQLETPQFRDLRRQDLDCVLKDLSPLDDAQQMLLFDLALGQLDLLTASEFSRLQRNVRQAIDRGPDGDVVRWAVGWQLRRRLQLVPAAETRPRYGKLSDIKPACELLISMLCHAGSEHEAMAQYAFQRSVADLQLDNPEFWSRDEISCERLDAAVQLVAELAPRPRRALLIGLGRSLAADRGVTASEAQFVRGLCAALALPAPAILPGQAVTPGA